MPYDTRPLMNQDTRILKTTFTTSAGLPYFCLSDVVAVRDSCSRGVVFWLLVLHSSACRTCCLWDDVDNDEDFTDANPLWSGPSCPLDKSL